MEETRQTVCNAANAICDLFRYLGDFSYAVLPREVAHDVGEINKTFLNCVRSAIDREIEWIDERLAGGDRMREEWRRSCKTEEPAEAAGPAS
jgi:hypothetical protein